jgi:hypothetical protein
MGIFKKTDEERQEFQKKSEDGNVVGTHSYRANTLNEGSVTSYGPDEKWYIDSTERIVKSVETYDVKCNL